MEDRGQPVVRIAEAIEQRKDAVEPEDVGCVDRRAQPVELGLDRPGQTKWRKSAITPVRFRGRVASRRGPGLFGCEIADQAREPVLQRVAVDDHVDHAMLEQIFGALEAFGKFLSDRLLDDALAGKAD
jgi:hypothetical protein